MCQIPFKRRSLISVIIYPITSGSPFICFERNVKIFIEKRCEILSNIIFLNGNFHMSHSCYRTHGVCIEIINYSYRHDPKI